MVASTVDELVAEHPDENLRIVMFVPSHLDQPQAAVHVPASRTAWALYRHDDRWLGEQVDLVADGLRPLPATTVVAGSGTEDPIQAVRTARELPAFPLGTGTVPTKRPNWTVAVE